MKTLITLILLLLSTAPVWPLNFTLTRDNTVLTLRLVATGHAVSGVVPIRPVTVAVDLTNRQVTTPIVIDALEITTANRGRDKKMHREVLKSATYPQITFTPRGFTGDLQRLGKSTITLLGEVTLLGTNHPIEIPLNVEMTATTLKASGTFDIPYVAWGLKDPSLLFLWVAKVVKMQLAIEATTDD